MKQKHLNIAVVVSIVLFAFFLGFFVRGWLAAKLRSDALERHVRSMLGANVVFGTWVSYIDPRSSAKEAGVQKGDFIIRVNGVGVENSNVLSYMLEEAAPNAQIDLISFRLDLEVGRERPKRISFKKIGSSTSKSSFPDPLLNNIAETTTSIGLAGISGLWISTTIKNSPASLGGLRPGDIIIRVNNYPMVHSRRLQHILENTLVGTDFSIHYLRLNNTNDAWILKTVSIASTSLEALSNK